MSGDKLDPIRLEIIANGLLRSIADECFVALMRSGLFDQHQGTQRTTPSPSSTEMAGWSSRQH